MTFTEIFFIKIPLRFLEGGMSVLKKDATAYLFGVKRISAFSVLEKNL
jgi:hypothetical protein